MIAERPRRLRVLMVSGSLPPMECGVGDYTARLAGALGATGAVDVTLLSTMGAGGEGPRLPDWRIRRLAALAQMIWRAKPDIVHLQYPTQGYVHPFLPSLVPLLAWLVTRARVVRTWHEPTTWRDLRRVRGVAQFFLQLAAPGRFVSPRPDFPERIHPVLARLGWRKRFEVIGSAAAIPVSRLDEPGRIALRAELLGGRSRLIVFFGFLYPNKGAELLFDIADHATDRIVFIGGHDAGSEYYTELKRRAGMPPWAGAVTFDGFVDPERAADILIAADAVILPFRDGAGSWNSSLLAARAQGSFVITTSRSPSGYEHATNTATVAVDDVVEMRRALASHWRSRRARAAQDGGWNDVAATHVMLYRAALR